MDRHAATRRLRQPRPYRDPCAPQDGGGCHQMLGCCLPQRVCCVPCA
jgi:hypothetical protein